MEVLRSIQQLEAIGDEWDVLAARRATPVLEHAWVLCCARAFHGARALRVVTVRRGARLVAAAPLVAVTRRGIGRLEIVGMSPLYEPGGLLYEDEAALHELANALVSIGAPVTLERLEAGSPEGRAVLAHVPRPGVVVVRRTASTLFVRVDSSWAEYSKHLSSRITGNLLRLRKRAGRLGAIRVEILSPTPEDTPALVESVMTVEASGWKGRGQSAMLTRPDLRRFFDAYSVEAARADRLRIGRLWFGDRQVAAELAVVAHGRWWQLKIGYDEALAEYYPGLQLTYETIRHAFEQRLEAYEFLGSAASWERRWNPEERPHELVAVYPRTPAALLGLTFDACGTVVRRAVHWVEQRRRAPVP
jgi:CelD/BcsL family acetyltransferase involved in cellulose biosynthesis